MKNQPVTIAIVEDHFVMRQLTNYRLSRLGYKVVLEAENGQIFLDQLNNLQAPDICILDINMPIMNGFETIIHLKKGWPDMKVIFLSMHEEDSYIKKSMELGADGFIKKDAPFEELKKTLLRSTIRKLPMQLENIDNNTASGGGFNTIID
jgi:DNA-binding NarL/FixJ family response regulator